MASLVIPMDVGKKRRNISREIDMIWADENGNYQMRDFTAEEEAELTLLEDLTNKAEGHRIGHWHQADSHFTARLTFDVLIRLRSNYRSARPVPI